MFGYVKAYKPELRVWELETYKAVYCSLCRNLGKTYGVLTRFTLSYDFVFLALLAHSLENGQDNFKNLRCPFNPLKKCKQCADKTKGLNLSSAAAMIMLYYKAEDNVSDSKGVKKLFYKLMLPFFKSKRKKAEKLYPDIDSIVKDYIEAQVVLEQNHCSNIDEICEPTSKALARIFEMCSEGEEQKRVLNNLGYCLGKWIYLIDCANDIEKDIKSGSYNVLRYSIPQGEDPKNYSKETLVPILNTCISNATLSFELLDIKKYKGILENILYLGLKASQKAVFEKEKK